MTDYSSDAVNTDTYGCSHRDFYPHFTWVLFSPVDVIWLLAAFEQPAGGLTLHDLVGCTGWGNEYLL